MYRLAILHWPSSNGSSVTNKKSKAERKILNCYQLVILHFTKIITLTNYVSKVSPYVPFQDLKSSGVSDENCFKRSCVPRVNSDFGY